MKLSILLTALVLVSCSPQYIAKRDYTKACMSHPTYFLSPADSATVIWERARTAISAYTTLVVDTDSLLQTLPASQLRSWAVTVTRHTIGDSALFAVYQDRIESEDLHGENRRWIGHLNATKPNAHELAFHMHTGLTRKDFNVGEDFSLGSWTY